MGAQSEILPNPGKGNNDTPSTQSMTLDVVKLGHTKCTKSRRLIVNSDGLFFLFSVTAPPDGEGSSAADDDDDGDEWNDDTTKREEFVIKRFIPILAIDALTTYSDGTVLHMKVKREHDVVLWKRLPTLSGLDATYSSGVGPIREASSIVPCATCILEHRSRASWCGKSIHAPTLFVPLTLRRCDDVPRPSHAQLAKDQITKMFPLARTYTTPGARWALRSYTTGLHESLSGGSMRVDANSLYLCATRWDSASRVGASHFIAFSQWQAVPALSMSRILPETQPSCHSLAEFLRQYFVVLMSQVRLISMTTTTVQRWPLLQQSQENQQEQQQLGGNKSFSSVELGALRRGVSTHRIGNELADTFIHNESTGMHQLLLTPGELILVADPDDNSPAREPLVKSLFTLATIIVHVHRSNEPVDSNIITTGDPSSGLASNDDGRLILVFEERVEKCSDSMAYRFPSSMAKLSTEGGGTVFTDRTEDHIVHTTLILKCAPSSFFLSSSSLSSSSSDGAGVNAVNDVCVLAKSIAVLLGRNGTDISICISSNAREGGHQTSSPATSENQVRWKGQPSRPKRSGFKLSWLRRGTSGKVKVSNEEEDIEGSVRDNHTTLSATINTNVPTMTPLDGGEKTILFGDARGYENEVLSALNTGLSGDADVESSRKSYDSSIQLDETPNRPPDYNKPMGAIPLRFVAEDTLLARQVQRLTSRKAWEPRVVAITRTELCICDDATRVRRRIPLNMILEMRLFVGHRDGQALTFRIRGEHDLLVRHHESTPSFLAMRDVASIIFEEQPSVVFDELPLFDTKGDLRQLLPRRELKHARRCVTIPETPQWFFGRPVSVNLTNKFSTNTGHEEAGKEGVTPRVHTPPNNKGRRDGYGGKAGARLLARSAGVTFGEANRGSVPSSWWLGSHAVRTSTKNITFAAYPHDDTLLDLEEYALPTDDDDDDDDDNNKYSEDNDSKDNSDDNDNNGNCENRIGLMGMTRLESKRRVALLHDESKRRDDLALLWEARLRFLQNQSCANVGNNERDWHRLSKTESTGREELTYLEITHRLKLLNLLKAAQMEWKSKSQYLPPQLMMTLDVNDANEPLIAERILTEVEEVMTASEADACTLADTEKAVTNESTKHKVAGSSEEMLKVTGGNIKEEEEEEEDVKEKPELLFSPGLYGSIIQSVLEPPYDLNEHRKSKQRGQKARKSQKGDVKRSKFSQMGQSNRIFSSDISLSLLPIRKGVLSHPTSLTENVTGRDDTPWLVDNDKAELDTAASFAEQYNLSRHNTVSPLRDMDEAVHLRQRQLQLRPLYDAKGSPRAPSLQTFFESPSPCLDSPRKSLHRDISMVTVESFKVEDSFDDTHESLNKAIHSLLPYERADDVSRWAREVTNPLTWLHKELTPQDLTIAAFWTAVRFQFHSEVMICVGNEAFVRNIRKTLPSDSLGSKLWDSVTCAFHPLNEPSSGSATSSDTILELSPSWMDLGELHHLLQKVSSVPISDLLLGFDSNISGNTNVPRILHDGVYCRVGTYRWFQIPLPLLLSDFN